MMMMMYKFVQWMLVMYAMRGLNDNNNNNHHHNNHNDDNDDFVARATCCLPPNDQTNKKTLHKISIAHIVL